MKIQEIYYNKDIERIVVRVNAYNGRYEPTFDPEEITSKEVLIQKLQEKLAEIDEIDKATPKEPVDNTPKNIDSLKELEDTEIF